MATHDVVRVESGLDFDRLVLEPDSHLGFPIETLEISFYTRSMSWPKPDLELLKKLLLPIPSLQPASIVNQYKLRPRSSLPHPHYILGLQK
jgi:hypothetical protein